MLHDFPLVLDNFASCKALGKLYLFYQLAIFTITQLFQYDALPGVVGCLGWGEFVFLNEIMVQKYQFTLVVWVIFMVALLVLLEKLEFICALLRQPDRFN